MFPWPKKSEAENSADQAPGAALQAAAAVGSTIDMVDVLRYF